MTTTVTIKQTADSTKPESVQKDSAHFSGKRRVQNECQSVTHCIKQFTLSNFTLQEKKS